MEDIQIIDQIKMGIVHFLGKAYSLRSTRGRFATPGPIDAAVPGPRQSVSYKHTYLVARNVAQCSLSMIAHHELSRHVDSGPGRRWQ